MGQKGADLTLLVSSQGNKEDKNCTKHGNNSSLLSRGTLNGP